MATTPADAFEALMDGVTSWDVPRGPIPCELLLTGEAAFPVMVNGKGQVLIAASSYGRGRLVVASHEGYLLDAGLAPFLRNAVHWLQPSRGAPAGVHPSLTPLACILQASGLEAQIQPDPGDPLRVYCINAYDDTLTAELTQFVKRGGGLLIGGQAWYWASQHGRDKVLSRFPGNQVTSVAGVYFTDIRGDRGQFKVSKKVPKIPLEVRCGEDLRQDQRQLLEGISELDIKTGGIPSQLLVHGALAFPLGLDASLGCFLAAARYGRGRVVLAAHEGLLCAPKMTPFLLNAVRWLARGKAGKVGVNTRLKNLRALLSEHGLKCSLEPHLTDGLHVYCCVAYCDKEAKQLQEFVAEGGGLLIGGQAWWWASQNPGRSALAGFPGNVILNCFGLSILSGTVSPGQFPVPTHQMLSYHFRRALSEFQAVLNQGRGDLEKSWLARLGVDGAAFLQIPAEGAPVYASLHRLLRKMLRSTGLPAVSRENPVARDSCEAAVLCLATELARSGTDCSQLVQGHGTWTCHSSLDPSEHPITVEINGSNPGDGESWVSTGLYLLNGRSAEVSLSEAATRASLKVQIGCHTDDLSEASKLSRAPVVTHRCCMDRTKQSVSCLWGGLLYVIVPKGSELGPVPVTIKRAVPAPYYKLGKTSLQEWRSRIQESPAPWGELATDNIILTVPTANLRVLEDPGPVLRLWDEMMRAIAKLAAKPFPFLRPERIVADVQISAGWMHSGYPIMCHLESAQVLISEASMRSSGLWGPIHELGHNQQQSGWEFPPHTTEATCNLWSVYVHETILGIPRAQAHPALNPAQREERIKEHLGKGAPLSDWNVWTALETYLQLQEAFGWEPFTRLFAEYQTFSGIPKDNASKMNLWVKKFSERVRKNLVPFFKAWGWPVQKEVADSLARLPQWQEDPMRARVGTEG
ncbi:TRPM8 channel-associated factor 2 isoform X2 [Rousettus aegyptiacus]|uniref:TRPM8 channel associated factor 2 n=3 Tax=Rousettus aegyptiacus TaxID=9407 RepID=A0A7J8D8S4_ROUAE|nr:TRPM8 channel-associated factor 2 isoform X2 [Rousettus aegyptiacus]XP_016012651.2 TRPM8 channel-associated factor 2 isoform X2 [Rousettus aegyptiacus]XP_016012652.2 TRPM8 channel-associated factor 2 isoform X2 [Rousettus aegyptiacus]XP_016012653.2 TRPM8 channel-associated factor 2 isoform X2 [Rousettus aegyptiacus]XP_036086650.1 TRPM8 channel-associated factor 2 isoform X2 [Rousettus aegyptiacus]KAF6419550.1 TRPM8 channel associated factor 2 [Rousettus aegyptiacus]